MAEQDSLEKELFLEFYAGDFRLRYKLEIQFKAKAVVTSGWSFSCGNTIDAVMKNADNEAGRYTHAVKRVEEHLERWSKADGKYVLMEMPESTD